MNFSKLSFVAMLAVAAMSSCSNDNELNSSKSEYINSVRVTVEDFQPETTTRTAYTVDGSGFHFQWTAGDALGIYPVGGDQVKFPISNGDGSASATFDGGAWKLRSEYQYAAYYPFSTNNYTTPETALPVSFTGQAQNGDASTAHLGAYDYLACAATAPDGNGGIDITMKHLGAFVRFQLTMPRADNFSSVVLESDGTKFVTAGTFDLTAATPAITPSATSSTYTISLTNVATTEKNQVITVYAIVAPANLSTSNITVTVHGIGQTTYVQTIQGKNFAARSAYNIAVDNFPSGTNASGEDVSWEEPATTGVENGHEWVDLGLPSGLKWATCNIGANSPEEFGGRYAWGETETKQWYSDEGSNYKYCTSSSPYKLTKYNYIASNGVVDNKTVLEPEDDAAHVNWGGQWRMPTVEETGELIENCIWRRATLNGVVGLEIESKKNGNNIFLPSTAIYSRYWTSSCPILNDWYESYTPVNCMGWNEWYGNFNNVIPSYLENRYSGFYVRPVCP